MGRHVPGHGALPVGKGGGSLHRGSGDRAASAAQEGGYSSGSPCVQLLLANPFQPRPWAPEVRNSHLAEEHTSPLTSHLPRPPLPHLPVPAAVEAMGNSLHPFTDNTGSPTPAASTPQAAPNLPARKNTSRLGFLPPSLPCCSGELVYCWVAGKL